MLQLMILVVSLLVTSLGNMLTEDPNLALEDPVCLQCKVQSGLLDLSRRYLGAFMPIMAEDILIACVPSQVSSQRNASSDITCNLWVISLGFSGQERMRATAQRSMQHVFPKAQTQLDRNGPKTQFQLVMVMWVVRAATTFLSLTTAARHSLNLHCKT